MKKFSWHKFYKFPTGHTLRSECEYPYKPPRKGGHRHNHIYNVCNRILFRSKSGRKICIKNKREWREIFEAQVFGGIKIHRAEFLKILKKGKYFKQIKR